METKLSELLPHLSSLYYFALQLTGDEEEAKDLVQEAYLKAMRFIHQYQEGTNAKAWLFTILKNQFINRYRQKQRQGASENLDQILSQLDGRLSVAPVVEQDHQEVKEAIEKALMQLSPQARAIIILADMEGFSYQEIAKILDIPIGTVRSRLHRARNQLRKYLIPIATRLGYKV